MRIAQLYHDFSQDGGAEQHIRTLSADLNRRGHEVTIVSQCPPAGFRVFPATFGRWSLPVSAVRLARAMRRQRVQLIHAHSRVSAFLASMAVRLYRIPLVVTCHILPVGFERITPWGDATICVSNAVRRRLVDRFGVRPERLRVIHNGIEPLSIAAPIELGTRPVISMVARFVPGKGHELFLGSAQRLLASGFPGTFVLAGDGPLLDGFRRSYAHERIVFLGHRQDVSRLFAGSTASVVCSESEAFPYVVLESLAQGTPVLATDCGGPAEMIREGFNGSLFPIGSAESLERLMVGAAQGLASRVEIAGECRERFHTHGMVEATLAVYRDFYSEC
jgi:glycosyltransferase involved in cell wall biosynthesis